MILPSEQDELTAQQQEAWLNHLANILQQYELRTPALLALEAGRPLSLLLGQLLWVTQPVASLFLPRQTITNTARLLENPKAVQALIAKLEQRKQPL